MRPLTKNPFPLRLDSIVIFYLFCLGVFLADGNPLAAGPPDESLDCRVYETREYSVTVGFKAGNMLFEMGPEVTFGTQRGIAWDRVVQGLIARYVELCTRYNGGLVDKEEYGTRLREIEALYQDAMKMERQLVQETHAHSKSAQNELDLMLKGKHAAPPPDPDALSKSLENLNQRIDKLDQIGQPLKQTTPCPTPDMLGMPGKSC